MGHGRHVRYDVAGDVFDVHLIPAILASAGGSAKLGGVMVALFSAVGFVGTLAIPPLAARMRNPFPLVVACLVCFLIGFAGLLWLPMHGTAVWVVALGFGPSTFPLGLTLVNLRTRTPAGSAALSGFYAGSRLCRCMPGSLAVRRVA